MAGPTSSRVPITIAKPPGSSRAAPSSTSTSSTNPTAAGSGSQSRSRAAGPRLKILIRRLAPGLTEKEFNSALGEAWACGAGKVDWTSYVPGKISRDPARPSRPARAYLHLVAEKHLAQLADHVRTTTFVDAKGTGQDAALLGPPVAEFAPYNRIPSAKVRQDARQGTIDQDPDLIDFLESLTNPTPQTLSTDADQETIDKSAVTPLVQYLRDKKANKAKNPASQNKVGKSARGDAKELSGKTIESRPATQVAKKETAANHEAATQDAVKAIKRQVRQKGEGEVTSAATKSSAKTSVESANKPSSTPTSEGKATSKPERKRDRDRGDLSAAARMLKRDLGLAQSTSRRKPDETISSSSVETASASIASKTAASNDKVSKNEAGLKHVSTSKQPSEPSSRTNGPASTKDSSQVTISEASSVKPAQRNGAAKATVRSKQAFIRNANPAQGVTTAAIETALAAFGSITRVEMDKKKCFAYLDFAEADSLTRAIAASPISVAKASVIVMERKDPASNASRRTSASNYARREAGAATRGRSGRNVTETTRHTEQGGPPVAKDQTPSKKPGG